nr:hypothetical protein [uncultured Bacteroides sp.]
MKIFNYFTIYYLRWNLPSQRCILPFGTAKIKYNREEWIKRNEDFSNFALEKETAQEELRRAKKEIQTEKTGFQVLKDPTTDGTRLVLAIDRKPIAEWFKEQFEKLRQNIRRPIQPQRKSRGILKRIINCTSAIEIKTTKLLWILIG